MKRRYRMVYVLAVLVLTACVHDFPTLTDDGETGVDPTLVEVSADVVLNLAFSPHEVRAKHSAAVFRRRFVVEVRRDNHTVVRQVVVMDEMGDNRYSLPLRLKLHAVEYTLAVWTDYVKPDSEADLYYHTGDMGNIFYTDPYAGNTDRRECLYGTMVMDLRPHRNQWNARVKVELDMVRPLARYEIVATDVEHFLKKMKITDAKEFFVQVFYDFYFPTAFDVWTGMPNDSRLGVAFTVPFDLPADDRQECVIVSDYIFAGNVGSFMPLTIELHDHDGNLISRVTGLKIPYERGHHTTVCIPFLTSQMGGGVDISPDFGGENDVDIDDLVYKCD